MSGYGPVVLNLGSGGSSVQVWTDASGRAHQAVVMETQTGAADPSPISTSNPMPIGGNIADAAADAGNSVKVGGVYSVATNTYTNGQRAPLQMDVNGYLKVNIAAGSSAGGTASSYGAAFPATGTAVGFLNSAGTAMAAGNLDASGFLKVNVAAGAAAGGTSSSYGAAFPAAGTAIGFKDSAGTSLAAGNLDASGNLKVNVASGSISAVTDNSSAFTAGVTQGLPLAYAYNDSASAVSSGFMGIARMTANRQARVVLDADTTASGGLSGYEVIAPATPAAVAVKASAGKIHFIHATNEETSIRYLKLWNIALGSVTLGTTAATYSLGIPPNSAGFTVPIPQGLSFTTAITAAITGAISLTDNTAITASKVNLVIGYA